MLEEQGWSRQQGPVQEKQACQATCPAAALSAGPENVCSEPSLNPAGSLLGPHFWISHTTRSPAWGAVTTVDASANSSQPRLHPRS